MAIPEIQDGIFDLCGGTACRFTNLFPKVIFNNPDPTYQFHSPEPKEDTLEQLKLETSAQETANVVFTAGAGANSIIIKMHKRSGVA